MYYHCLFIKVSFIITWHHKEVIIQIWTLQVGIGTFVSAGNIELLRDSKRRVVEEKMADMIKIAKTLGITQSELQEMMDILFEDEV